MYCSHLLFERKRNPLVRNRLCNLAYRTPSHIEIQFNSYMHICNMNMYIGCQKLSIIPKTNFSEATISTVNIQLMLYWVSTLIDCGGLVPLMLILKELSASLSNA